MRALDDVLAGEKRKRCEALCCPECDATSCVELRTVLEPGCTHIRGAAQSASRRLEGKREKKSVFFASHWTCNGNEIECRRIWMGRSSNMHERTREELFSNVRLAGVRVLSSFDASREASSSSLVRLPFSHFASRVGKCFSRTPLMDDAECPASRVRENLSRRRVLTRGNE